MQRPRRRKASGARRALTVLGLLTLGTAGVLLAATADISGSTVTFPGLKKWFGPAKSTVLTHKVAKADLAITVKEKGQLESANNLEAKCEVEGQTTIISILPEGTRVVKDQLVCELDSAAKVDELTNQRIATERAKADKDNAVKTWEVAEIDVNEYKLGTYPQELKTVEGEIKLAQSELTRAEDRLEWSNRMLNLGYISQAQNLSDQYALQQAEFKEAQARQKKDVLQEYTYEKQLKTLQGNVEKALADKLAKEQTFQLETEKEDKLSRMIEKCQIFAPGNGIVVYHQEQGRFGAQEGPSVQEGATVRERQIIFKLPDIDNMQVNTKVHESMVNKVKKGLSCKVRVDAFPNNRLEGEVIEVKPLPDPTSFFSSDIKVYTTLVRIKNGNEGLRPGMSAETEILIAKLPGVLSVPVQAIVEYGGKSHVWVRKADGTWANTIIGVGLSNTKYVEVKEGLAENDLVTLDPRAVMTETERQLIAGAGGDDSKKDGADSKEWSAEDAAKAKAAGNGKAGAPGAEAKKKGGRGGMGGMTWMRGVMSKVSEEDRAKVFTGSDDERKEILKKAGATDEQIKQLEEARANMPAGGFGGGPPGGGGGGPGGGGGGGGPRP